MKNKRKTPYRVADLVNQIAPLPRALLINPLSLKEHICPGSKIKDCHHRIEGIIKRRVTAVRF